MSRPALQKARQVLSKSSSKLVDRDDGAPVFSVMIFVPTAKGSTSRQPLQIHPRSQNCREELPPTRLTKNPARKKRGELLRHNVIL